MLIFSGLRKDVRGFFRVIILTGRANFLLYGVHVNYKQSSYINKIQYINSGFHGHKILSFSRGLPCVELGRGYYKLNTSILADPRYQDLVQGAVREASSLNAPGIDRWLTFLSIIRSDSMAYSRDKAAVKTKLKVRILEDLESLEES